MRENQNRAIWHAGTLAILFLGSALWAAGPQDESFFPWTQKSEWVYSTLNKSEKDRFDMNVVMQEPWKDGDISGMVMTQKDKRGTMRQFLYKNEKGIFLQKLGLSKSYTPEVNTRFSPAVPMLIFPLVPGTKVHWDLDTGLD